MYHESDPELVNTHIQSVHAWACIVYTFLYVVRCIGAHVCRFDYHWLKDKRHHNVHTVKQDKNLSNKEKEYIKGIHKRHGCLAKQPSETDLTELRKAYTK